ncbi:MAG: DedA family protein [Anaerolineae bacterium]|nr:DedA family protein [Anaerolineae bacterium]
MAGILDQLANLIQSLIAALGYAGIAIVMFAENIFPPIPSELVMPFAGFIVGEHIEELTLGNILSASGEQFSFVGVIIAGTLGALLGALCLYYLGRWADEPVIRAFIRRYGRWFLLTEDDLDRALAFFNRYGEPIMFFGRLIPIIRSLISIPAGMNRMNMPRFLLFTTLGATVWNIVLTVAGVILGANWELVLDIVDKYQYATLAVLLLAAALFVVVRLRERRKAKAAAGVETPAVK